MRLALLSTLTLVIAPTAALGQEQRAQWFSQAIIDCENRADARIASVVIYRDTSCARYAYEYNDVTSSYVALARSQAGVPYALLAEAVLVERLDACTKTDVAAARVVDQMYRAGCGSAPSGIYTGDYGYSYDPASPTPTPDSGGYYAAGGIYTTTGNVTVDSHGNIYSTSGDVTVGSNGQIYTTTGNVTVGSDGSVFTNVGGGVTVGSNGVTCVATGSVTVCN